MHSHPRRILFGIVAMLGSVVAADAATATFWQVATRADFLKGEVEHLSIDSDGRLVLGPVNDLVHETTAPFLWSIAASPDGSLWIGSGTEGKVFRIAPDGTATTFFDAPELEAHALALAPDGHLYVGTSPDGRIYKVAPDGTFITFFEPEDKYIWSMVVDGEGNLFVATGDRGSIYRIRPDGHGELFYRTNSTHVVSLAFDRTGNLLASTESPGRVFRIDPQGKPFVLMESSFPEIRALRVDDRGYIYAAAVSGRPVLDDRRPVEQPLQPDRTQPVPTVSAEITAIAIADVSVQAPPQAAAAPRRDDRRPRGAVYRISPDGIWDQIWDSAEDTPYDLAFDGTGGLLIATGDNGRIYRIEGDPVQTTLLTRAGARQVTRFLRDEQGRHYYATANPGKLFRLDSTRVPTGTYESEVRDATTVATWGTIRWRAIDARPGSIEVFTRSGNTAMPDETWSGWAGPYRNAEGEQIDSPRARYLQWRVVMNGGGESPILTSVTTAYVPRNLRPRVTSITVHPPGVVFQRPYSTGEAEIAGFNEQSPDARAQEIVAALGGSAPAGGAPAQAAQAPALGRRAYHKGLQTFVWRAEDGNADTLEYSILYRQDGETGWRTLKENLSEPIFVWDTTSVPDGTYVLKVVASDAPSNPVETTLTGELESTTFDVDNTPPSIERVEARPSDSDSVLSFIVRDDQSPVHRVEYSLDGSRWRPIFPVDGIADSLVEEFEIWLEPDARDRTVIIRATDMMNNSATTVAHVPGSGSYTR